MRTASRAGRSRGGCRGAALLLGVCAGVGSLWVLPFAPPARAEQAGGGAVLSRLDPRVRSVVFADGQVVPLVIPSFRVAVIEFAQDEVLQTVRTGDTEGWEVSPNDLGNRLFVKPRMVDIAANLIAVTDRRTYVFSLESRKEGARTRDAVYRVRFVYPEEERAQREAVQLEQQKRAQALVSGAGGLRPEHLYFSYQFSGDEGLVPDLLFDDGRATYFRFANLQDLPAIFVVQEVNGEKREALANYRVEGEYVVVHRLASQYSLRVGDRMACILRKEPAGPKRVLASVSGPRAQRLERAEPLWLTSLLDLLPGGEDAAR